MTITELAEKSAFIRYTYKITPEVYYSFQRVSNDYNPLHTDEAFAKEKGFAGRVMYGNILNAFVSHFVGMLLPTRDVMIYTQDIKFHKPVYLYDEIELTSKVEDVSEAGENISYKIVFRKVGVEGNDLIAKGHVLIGLLNKK